MRLESFGGKSEGSRFQASGARERGFSIMYLSKNRASVSR
jgi:hypothetical protein